MSAEAAADIENIVEWTARNFGDAQAKRYSAIIEHAVASLTTGPIVLGSLPFRTRHGQYRKIHLTLRRKGASHLLFYRETAPSQLTIMRVLHERMDAGRHLSGVE